jgi:hypothetical protein
MYNKKYAPIAVAVQQIPVMIGAKHVSIKNNLLDNNYHHTQFTNPKLCVNNVIIVKQILALVCVKDVFSNKEIPKICMCNKLYVKIVVVVRQTKDLICVKDVLINIETQEMDI